MDGSIKSNSKILYLQGPNIHALGQRQPEIYGAQTYLDLTNQLDAFAQSKGFEAIPVSYTHLTLPTIAKV